jgi:hypothetical protein
MVAPYKTDAWGLVRGDLPSTYLLVRTEDESGGRLLLTIQESNRYQPKNGAPARRREFGVYAYSGLRLSPTEHSDWDSARGEVVDWFTQVARENREFEIKSDTRELYFAGKPIRTMGSRALGLTTSPRSDTVAVLSADGHRSGLALFGAADNYSGLRYHEIFRASDGQRVGPAVGLDEASGIVVEPPFWSAGGDLVIYSDFDHRHLWIVPCAAFAGDGVKSQPHGGS